MLDELNQKLEIIKKFDEEINLYNGISNILAWDEATYMPKNGSESRAKQKALIELKKYELFNSKELIDIVQHLKLKENYSLLNPLSKRKIDLLYEEIDYNIKLPKEHVEKSTLLESKLYNLWENLEDKDSFEKLAPLVKELFDLKKQEAKYVDSNKHPYDVMLNNFEEGLSVDKLDKLFTELKKELIPIIKNVITSKNYSKINNRKLSDFGPFNILDQEVLCNNLASKILTRGNYNVATTKHPFMASASRNDCRVAIGFEEYSLASIGSTTHECGHALFAMGLDEKFEYSSFSNVGFGFDESQSRLWENIICNSKHFWEGYHPILIKQFPKLSSLSSKDLYVMSNQVRNSLIRVDADELTYPMHIVIRYELEKELFENKISITDLEKEWNDRYEQYLGIRPDSSKNGILQDVHWYCGLIGYFPSYNVGNIYSATIYNSMKKSIPNLEQEIQNLDFTNIRNWLTENIYRHGASKTTQEVMFDVCGKDLDISEYVSYLKNKYYNIYHIKE